MKHLVPLMTYLSPLRTAVVRMPDTSEPASPPAELLPDQTTGGESEPGPAVLLRDVVVHQAELPGLLDDLRGEGGVLVQLPGDRPDLLLGEVVGELANVLLLVGKREVDHCFYSSD